MKIFIFLIVASITNFVKAQYTTNELSVIEAVVINKTNELRVKKKLKILILSDTLTSAARLQTNYMLEKKEVTHFQKQMSLKTIEKRLATVGAKNLKAWGENVLSTPEITLTKSQVDLIKIGELIFTQWKNSPAHLRNMLSKDFTHIGISLQCDDNTKIIYATEVFGMKVKSE